MITPHTVSLVSCHPRVTQHCESPTHGQEIIGSDSPHFPHRRLLIDLMWPLTRASSCRISIAMYSASSYGSRPGRRAAQLRASMSSSCTSRTSSIFRLPAADCRALCAALRSADDLAINHLLAALTAFCHAARSCFCCAAGLSQRHSVRTFVPRPALMRDAFSVFAQPDSMSL